MQLAFIFDEVITENPALDGITEEEMIGRISKATGLIFKKREGWGWECKKGKHKLNFYYGNWNYWEEKHCQGPKHEERCIDCGYDYGMGGCGRAVNTIEEAIEFANKYKEFFKRGK